MTRKRKRDIERWLDDVESGDAGREFVVAHRNAATGELTNRAGDRVEPSGVCGPGQPLVVIEDRLVIPREQAEREGREILGRAETPGKTEHVRTFLWGGE